MKGEMGAERCEGGDGRGRCEGGDGMGGKNGRKNGMGKMSLNIRHAFLY